MSNPIRDRALIRLGVTYEALAAVPQITPHLRQIAMTLRRAGQPKRVRRLVNTDTHQRVATIDETQHALPYGPGVDLLTSWPLYLASSDHADARRLLLTFYSVHPKMRHDAESVLPAAPIEAYCLAAQVHPHSILAILTGEIVRLGASANTIIAAVNQPRVVQHLVDRALDTSDDKSMEAAALLSKATGFLPSPRGAQTVVSVIANANAQAAAAPIAIAAPPAEQTIRRMIDRVNESRGLPPAAPDTLPSHMPSEDAVEILADSDEDDE